jgi:hypothetical protein
MNSGHAHRRQILTAGKFWTASVAIFSRLLANATAVCLASPLTQARTGLIALLAILCIIFAALGCSASMQLAA